MLNAILLARGKFNPIRRTSVVGTWGDRAAYNTATVTLDIGGTPATRQAGGAGPIDAAFAAVMAACDIEASLENFSLVTKPGAGAAGVGCICLKIGIGGQLYTGKANDSNVLLAAVDASLAAVNKMLRARRRQMRNSCDRRVA